MCVFPKHIFFNERRLFLLFQSVFFLTCMLGMNNHGVGYDLHDNEEITYEGNREFSTDLYTRKAVDIIANHDTTKTTKPLFLYLSYQVAENNKVSK